MSAHTPGPWDFGKTGKTFQHIDSDGRWWGLAKVVITVSGDPCGEGLANARLIAAAPEILEALRTVLIDLNTPREAAALALASAAIAKATQP